MIKLILEHHYTKRDTYGNVYHVVKIINTNNRKKFCTKTPDISNIEHILWEAGFSWEDYYIVDAPTDSTRISSLPGFLCLPQCQYTHEWKKNLNNIGIHPKKSPKE